MSRIPKEITEHNITIADGDIGIQQTVDYMWNYALRDSEEPEVKELVKTLQGKNEEETLANIFNWVITSVSYELDPPETELVTAPIHFVNGNITTGDCDCMTTLLICLLEAAGFESAITVIAWRSENFTHVFAEVKINNKWFVLDPTLGWDGYLGQDKKIIKSKRTERKDMAKLTVLADGATDTAATYSTDRRSYNNLPPTQRGKRNKNTNCNKNKNDNGNNINIHFGNIGTQDTSSYSPFVATTDIKNDTVGARTSKLPQFYKNYSHTAQSKTPPGGWDDINNKLPVESDGDISASLERGRKIAKFYPEFP